MLDRPTSRLVMMSFRSAAGHIVLSRPSTVPAIPLSSPPTGRRVARR